MRKRARGAIERPTYLLESVDNALRLLQMLRDGGAVRLTEAAEELGVAPSTAHRLLAMLVYRGFAVQDEKRTYLPGPALRAGPAERGWTREFTDVCLPHLEALSTVCGETVNLVIRVGTGVRFLTSVESTAMLRVGDRRGQVLPAERTAGGRALLAELDDEVVERLYADRSAGQRTELLTELAAVREVGFGLNVEHTEEGVAAFGAVVRNRLGRAVGAVTVAVPIVRYQRHARGDLVRQLFRTADEISVDLDGRFDSLEP